MERQEDMPENPSLRKGDKLKEGLEEGLSLLYELSVKDPQLEFFLEYDQGRSIEKRDGKLYLREEYQDLTLTVRYQGPDGRVGLSYGLSLTKEEVFSTIRRAKELSKEGKLCYFPAFPSLYPEVLIPEVSPPDFLGMLSLLEASSEIKNEFPQVKRVERESLSYNEERIYLLREGKLLAFQGPLFSYEVSVVAEEERSGQAYAYGFSRTLEGLNFPELFRSSCQKAMALAKAKKEPGFKCAILFPPEVGVNLLDILSFSFLGDEVVKGRSRLKDRLGEKVFAEAITILDDGLTPELPSSRPFDDEGVPQERKILVERGVLKGYLFDTTSGKEAGFFSTGNARRPSYGQNPKPEITNFYLKEGNLKEEELCQSFPYVFVVLELLGAHTADPISGEFSFGVSGILYHQGEPIGYLSEMALTGNLFEILSQDVLLGNNLAFYGNLGMPSLLIPELTLG